jgi:hypothetical protein
MIQDIFLLAGGASARYLNAIDNGLFLFLQDKCCIGINCSYKFVNTTCSSGIDETLYNDKEKHDEIKQLPLWIGKDHRYIRVKESNSIFLKPSKKYDRDLKEGVYKASLSGIFALSLAIKLLDEGTVYLLGYDYGSIVIDGKELTDSKGRPLTHWHQEDFEQRGTGKNSWYKQTRLDETTKVRRPYAEIEFEPFASESKVKIYNVGGLSHIPYFEHIMYEDLFKRKFETVNQDEARKEIREKLLWIKQNYNI